MKKLTTAVAVVALALSPAAAQAQSIFNSAGLGRPVDAVDGRARALGNFGIGLRGGFLSPGDPAAAGRLGLASGVMVTQPSWVEASRDGTSVGDFRGTRFPLIGLAYPLLGGMGTVQLGSVLDQRFQSELTASVDLGGTPFDVVDRFEQDGGVSSATVGYARMLREGLAVGFGVTRYTGSVTRSLTRDFGDLDLEGAESLTTRGRWSYSGTGVTAGASADIGSVGRAAASIRWSSGLDATATSTTLGRDRSFDLPLEIRVGASAVLSPGLLVVASAMLADWSEIGDDFDEEIQVGNASGFGAGVEFSSVRMLGRSAPLRFGYRYNGLPFGVGTGEAGSERAFTGGLGFAFNETNGLLLAGADLALERGERKAGTIVERFWRLTAAIRVSGF